MVRFNQYSRRVSLEFRAPGLESFNNSEQLFVEDVVVAFSWGHTTRVISNRFPEVVVKLGEDSADSTVRSVCFHTGLKIRVIVCKDWGFFELGLKVLKGFFALGSLDKSMIFLSKGC